MQITNARYVNDRGWYDVTVTPDEGEPYDYTVAPGDDAPMAVAIREFVQTSELPIAGYVAPIERRRVSKDLVEQRLAAVGKLDACMAIIMGNAAYFSRWYARAFPFVYADDPNTIAVLDQVGADPVSILAA